ncbi:MAG: PKD domain-containing protein [Bacteroidetes bacterium]|nr:PKD domain-containing protein [Bacteroidota bacterium]
MKKSILLLLFASIGWPILNAQIPFTRYAPTVEHHVGNGQLLDMAIHPDGSMAFLSLGDPIFGNVLFREPDGTTMGSGLYKCGADIPPVKQLLPHPDGGYYIVGIHQHFLNDTLCPNFHFDTLMQLAHPDIWVLRIDAAGEVLWSQSVGGSKPEGVDNAIVTQAGDLLVFGHTNSNDGDVSYPDNPPNGFFNAPWMVKISAQGQVLWDFQAPWSLASSNYFFNGVEMPDGNVMVFNVEDNEFVELYRLSANGEELAHHTVPLPENVQGFHTILPYQNDKVLLGGTGEMVAGSFSRAAYLLLVDTTGVKLAERFLKNNQQDHYFESMFIQGDEAVVAGSYYDYDGMSLASLELPTLFQNSYQRFESSNVPFVHRMLPLDENRVAVMTDIQPDQDFQWTQSGIFYKGFVEFERCNLGPSFSYQNSGANTVQFTNTSTGGAIDFAWDFGGLGSSFSENPSFTFPAMGEYTVCLNVVDEKICGNKICQQVTVGINGTGEEALASIQWYLNDNQLIFSHLLSKTTARVFAPDGRFIMEKNLSASGESISLERLGTGVFLLVLKNENGSVTERFAKFD